MKKLTQTIVCLTAVITLLSILGYSPALAETPLQSTLDKNSIYIENSYCKLEVYPHTSHNITTQTQYCNLTWKQPLAQLDIALRFQTQIIHPQLWLWANYSHPKTITTYDARKLNYILKAETSIEVKDPKSVDFGDIPSTYYADITVNKTHYIIGYDEYDKESTYTYSYDQPTTKQIITNYWDWQPFGNESTKVQDKTQTYYPTNTLTASASTTYHLKFQYTVHPQTSGEYEVLVKLKTDQWSSSKITLDPWWDANWGYRKLITINATGSTMHNFPILIYRATDSDLAAHAQDNGGDIAFVSFFDNTTQLHHEIERFNGTSNGNLVCWLNVTTLYGNKPTRIWMYYGNPASPNQQQPHLTWNSHYKLVVHFNESTGDSIDKTYDNYNGTVNGAPNYLASGIAGYSVDFDATGGYFNHGDQANLKPATNGFTLEGWVTTTDGSWQGMYGTKNWNVADGYGMYTGGGTTYMQIVDNAPGVAFDLTTRFCYAVGQHISNVAYTIMNVTTIGTEACGDDADTTRPFMTGTNTNLGQKFKGRIDEVRYSDINWNHSWLYTCYNTTVWPTVWHFFGPEEAPAAPAYTNPEISLESPTNLSTGICPCCNSLCITVIQAEGKNVNISFYSPTTLMTYIIKNVPCNTSYCILAESLDMIVYNKTYYWRVNVSITISSHIYNISDTYHFTTAVDPALCAVTPSGGSVTAGTISDDSIGIVGVIGIFGLLGMFIVRKRRPKE